MKKVILLAFYCLITCSTFAQSNKIISNFSKFYKENQTDSIYNLFSSKMRSAITLEGTGQFMAQLKGQLGEIIAIKESKADSKGVAEFTLSFERPVVDLSLFVIKDSIAGIVQKAAQPKGADSTDLESPDNFTVDNTIGKLYGTLTLPKDKNKVPVVLMIGGSGPTDRNMNQGQALKTNSFLLLAKGLADNGIASVRYDKRGVGKSINATKNANVILDDFINDAKLFINQLSSDSRFSKIIILGHSEGALIGLVTSLQMKPAAYISLAGVDHNMVDLIGDQLKPALSPQDFVLFQEVSDSLKAGKTIKKDLPLPLAGLFTTPNQLFLISTLKYDASKEIKKLKIPILVIGGTTDIQVPAQAATNLSKMNKGATLQVIPEMNHVLKKAPADRASNVATYNNPSLPLHAELVPVLTKFIHSIK